MNEQILAAIREGNEEGFGKALILASSSGPVENRSTFY